ncbi:transaldolase family protein [Streptacidiphilus sp. N1-12]|uniref:Transaldolase n=2 Tax=Streptacidiphilus alkalitolerans TaxID=3342712 RepID=A0ABV6WL21_9ACTN
MSIDLLKQLQSEGVSLWLDGVTRNQSLSGEFATLVRDRRITGAVHAPDVLADGLHERGYHRQLIDLAARGVDPATSARQLLADDLRLLCDALAPVHTAADGRDGLVSATAAAVPLQAAAAEARALHWAVDRPNVLVRAPAGGAWLPVVSELLADGIGVDVGPVYSPERYGEVVDAYFDGLERARLNGRDLSAIPSVATFPLGQLDAALEHAFDLLRRPGPAPLRHRICTAVARLAYREFDLRYRSDRWRALAAAGARPQRLLWSGTEAIGPAGPDTRHVDGFVAWGVVSSVSLRTLEAVADHALLEGDTLSGRHISAERDLANLSWLGVSHQDLARRLEADHLEQLTVSWSKLLQRVTDELERRR